MPRGPAPITAVFPELMELWLDDATRWGEIRLIQHEGGSHYGVEIISCIDSRVLNDKFSHAKFSYAKLGISHRVQLTHTGYWAVFSSRYTKKPWPKPKVAEGYVIKDAASQTLLEDPRAVHYQTNASPPDVLPSRHLRVLNAIVAEMELIQVTPMLWKLRPLDGPDKGAALPDSEIRPLVSYGYIMPSPDTNSATPGAYVITAKGHARWVSERRKSSFKDMVNRPGLKF